MATHFKLDMTNRSTRITIFSNVSDNFDEEYRNILSGSSTNKSDDVKELEIDNMNWAMQNIFSNTDIEKPDSAEPVEESIPKKKSINSDTSEFSRKYAIYNYNKRLKKRSEQFRTDAYMNFKIPNVHFVTLTFDSRRIKDATDLKICHNAFKKFIQRIHYEYDDFIYISTFSRQKKTDNWHYHMLCNFDINVKNKYIQDKWSYGMVSSTPLTSHDEFQSRIAYCIDNMYEVAWDDLQGEKGYLNSKGLIKRVTFRSWKESEADEAYNYFSQVLNSTDRPLDQSSKVVENIFDEKITISKKISHKVFYEFFENVKVAKKKVCVLNK